MNVIFDHGLPFFLAHGGTQTQIEQTMAAVRREGFTCDYAHWWDASQPVDLIHYVGRPSDDYVETARRKNIKLVVAELHTRLASRSPFARAVQWGIKKVGESLLPPGMFGRLGWNAYRKADAFVALNKWEASLMTFHFDANPARVHVIPNGVEQVFLNEAPPPAAMRNRWLVCTATITERKRVVELAETAVAAATPLWTIGKPYALDDPYFLRFQKLVSKNPELLRYEGAVDEPERMAKILREARGFVLLSAMESHSLSSEEAAACGCPLLLSDLPWAHSVYGNEARYCPLSPKTGTSARFLKQFYDACPDLPPPRRPEGWKTVGKKLATLYRQL